MWYSIVAWVLFGLGVTLVAGYYGNELEELLLMHPESYACLPRGDTHTLACVGHDAASGAAIHRTAYGESAAVKRLLSGDDDAYAVCRFYRFGAVRTCEVVSD